MTKFDRFDHDNALRACWDATDFGAAITDADLVTLNRAAGAFAANEPETLTRSAFTDALTRVRTAVETAKAADPKRAARVEADRIAKYKAAHAAKREAERAARAARYETAPEFRARCDAFGTKPKGAQ